VADPDRGVATLIGSGLAGWKWFKFHPVEAAIVTAANRMQLMPFAQIATRIRGALAVTLAPLSIAPSMRNAAPHAPNPPAGLPGGRALDEAHAEGAN
jgi:hypothetical protein